LYISEGVTPSYNLLCYVNACMFYFVTPVPIGQFKLICITQLFELVILWQTQFTFFFSFQSAFLQTRMWLIIIVVGRKSAFIATYIKCSIIAFNIENYSLCRSVMTQGIHWQGTFWQAMCYSAVGCHIIVTVSFELKRFEIWYLREN